jgi:methylmalonyl-CoA mutase N-terminal domain/subunit
MPGVLAGIEEGWFQQEIADAAFRDQLRIEKGRRVIVGVNDFEETLAKEIEILRISPDVEKEQRQALADLRASRDNDAVASALATLTAAARTDENLIPLIVEAVRAEATEGEIVDALREVFGDYREAPRF